MCWIFKEHIWFWFKLWAFRFFIYPYNSCSMRLKYYSNDPSNVTYAFVCLFNGGYARKLEQFCVWCLWHPMNFQDDMPAALMESFQGHDIFYFRYTDFTRVKKTRDDTCTINPNFSTNINNKKTRHGEHIKDARWYEELKICMIRWVW